MLGEKYFEDLVIYALQGIVTSEIVWNIPKISESFADQLLHHITSYKRFWAIKAILIKFGL